MKLNNGYRIEDGVIYRDDLPVGAIDVPEVEGFMGAIRHSDTLLDMFAMAALPSVAREWNHPNWPREAYNVAAAMIQERQNRDASKRAAPAASEDGGGSKNE